jgi:hypothetical protein
MLHSMLRPRSSTRSGLGLPARHHTLRARYGQTAAQIPIRIAADAREGRGRSARTARQRLPSRSPLQAASGLEKGRARMRSALVRNLNIVLALVCQRGGFRHRVPGPCAETLMIAQKQDAEIPGGEAARRFCSEDGLARSCTPLMAARGTCSSKSKNRPAGRVLPPPPHEPARPIVAERRRQSRSRRTP